MPDPTPSQPAPEFDPDVVLADALRDDGLDDPHIHDIGVDNA